MTTYGVDYSWGRPNIATLWSQGFRFVARYLSYNTTGKNLTKSELDALRKQGFKVMLIWEESAGDMKGGASAGKTHATEAVRQARALGVNGGGVTLYFACDWDASSSELSGPVKAYLQAAGAVVRAAGFRLGFYGGYRSVKYAFDAKLIDDGWQTYAWSGGSWDSRAAVQQYQNNVTVAGAAVDRNRLTGVATHMVGDAAAAPDATAAEIWNTYKPADAWSVPGDYLKLARAAAQELSAFRTDIAALRAAVNGDA